MQIDPQNAHFDQLPGVYQDLWASWEDSMVDNGAQAKSSEEDIASFAAWLAAQTRTMTGVPGQAKAVPLSRPPTNDTAFKGRVSRLRSASSSSICTADLAPKAGMPADTCHC